MQQRSVHDALTLATHCVQTLLVLVLHELVVFIVTLSPTLCVLSRFVEKVIDQTMVILDVPHFFRVHELNKHF